MDLIWFLWNTIISFRESQFLWAPVSSYIWEYRLPHRVVRMSKYDNVPENTLNTIQDGINSFRLN